MQPCLNITILNHVAYVKSEHFFIIDIKTFKAKKNTEHIALIEHICINDIRNLCFPCSKQEQAFEVLKL